MGYSDVSFPLGGGSSKLNLVDDQPDEDQGDLQ